MRRNREAVGLTMLLWQEERDVAYHDECVNATGASEISSASNITSSLT
jgi:hypothetical protein